MNYSQWYLMKDPPPPSPETSITVKYIHASGMFIIIIYWILKGKLKDFDLAYTVHVIYELS